MNKYQEYLLKNRSKEKGTFIFTNCAPVGEVCKDDTYGCYTDDTGCFLIKQDSDITKTRYELSISKKEYPFIEAVQTKKDGVYTDVPLSCANVLPSAPKSLHRQEMPNERFLFTVDFNDRIDAIRLKFIKNIADDVEIGITYQEADKQAYLERQEILRKENILKRAAVKHSTGDSLINIYFQPCADEYDHTEISLFVPDKTETKRVGSPHGPVNQENVLSWSLIMKTTVENGTFFKSVTGLAYGRYAYIVKQFSKENRLLVDTGYIEFYIRQQRPPLVQEGNVVVI